MTEAMRIAEERFPMVKPAGVDSWDSQAGTDAYLAISERRYEFVAAHTGATHVEYLRARLNRPAPSKLAIGDDDGDLE